MAAKNKHDNIARHAREMSGMHNRVDNELGMAFIDTCHRTCENDI